jgi:integrase
MAGATRFGINWAKIPTDQEEAKLLEASKVGGHPAHYWPIFNFAAQTGWRICEIMHARWEHLLPGNMMEMTPRKKRVLRSQTRDLFPEFAAFLYEYGRGKTGWMFPGGSAPCIIMRRPMFVETHCPDCGRQLVRLDQIRKKCDRIAHFATHLQQEHGRTPDEVQEWIDFASKDVREKVCEGGHLHVRSVQTRFRLVLTQVGAYVRGRGIHSIRHAFAVQLWKETRDLMLVKQMLGHEQVTTTQVYATAVDTREKLQQIGSPMRRAA